MQLKRLSLILLAISTLLTLSGAVVKVQALGTPSLSSYLLGGGISLLIASFIGLYLAPQRAIHHTTDAAPEDDALELPELKMRPRKNENLL